MLRYVKAMPQIGTSRPEEPHSVYSADQPPVFSQRRPQGRAYKLPTPKRPPVEQKQVRLASNASGTRASNEGSPGFSGVYRDRLSVLGARIPDAPSVVRQPSISMDIGVVRRELSWYPNALEFYSTPSGRLSSPWPSGETKESSTRVSLETRTGSLDISGVEGVARLPTGVVVGLVRTNKRFSDATFVLPKPLPSTPLPRTPATLFVVKAQSEWTLPDRAVDATLLWIESATLTSVTEWQTLNARLPLLPGKELYILYEGLVSPVHVLLRDERIVSCGPVARPLPGVLALHNGSIKDILRQVPEATHQHLLDWGHLAPTCPDTYCGWPLQPGVEHDPYILRDFPSILITSALPSAHRDPAVVHIGPELPLSSGGVRCVDTGTFSQGVVLVFPGCQSVA